jgi:signal transduction histidine kinase
MSDSAETRFRVSPQILRPLGLEQLQDPGLAVLELIKNSWDADAPEVRVIVSGVGPSGSIQVEDSGLGMSRSDFENHWLVFGDTHKRENPLTPGGRPVIGEKGLGRLACFALGSQLRIVSKKDSHPAFTAAVDWDVLMQATSLDAVPIQIDPATRSIGTTVAIQQLKRAWRDEDTDLLVRHVEFLAIPSPTDKFAIHLQVEGKSQTILTRPDVLEQFAEAEIEVRIGEDGVPNIFKANLGQTSYLDLKYRPLRESELDPRLSGAAIRLLFFRRTSESSPSEVLMTEQARGLLEKYEGVRVFRDGLNVPPYGLAGMDWARLEKQRTATGGPTMVPGNSQLIGEVRLSRDKQAHLTVTAGRAGFTDQEAVERLGAYVRWAARCVGTFRRAAQMEIAAGPVPARVPDRKGLERTPVQQFRRVIRSLSPSETPSREKVQEVVESGRAILGEYDRQEGVARIYAQLATTGASAASFAHELRKDFDVVTDVVEELSRNRRRLGRLEKPVQSLIDAWRTIRGFVRLFRLVPVKTRRRLQVVSGDAVRRSIETLVSVIPHPDIAVTTDVKVGKVKLVPAELDSIVLNLYTNAVKAIRESRRRTGGQIGIKIYSLGATLTIDVLDNGVGVSSGVARMMWEPAEGSFSEGTGMGLPITRFLARLYRGEVSHTTRPEEGFETLFRVQLRGVLA